MNYKIQQKEDVLRETDDPILKHGIIEFHKEKIILPRKAELRPDQERLVLRFERFLKD